MPMFSLFCLAYNKTRNKVKQCSRYKKTFFDYKRNICESPKNRIFPKGLTHAFGQKIPILSFLVLVKTRLEIRFNNVLDRKETVFGV